MFFEKLKNLIEYYQHMNTFVNGMMTFPRFILLMEHDWEDTGILLTPADCLDAKRALREADDRGLSLYGNSLTNFLLELATRQWTGDPKYNKEDEGEYIYLIVNECAREQYDFIEQYHLTFQEAIWGMKRLEDDFISLKILEVKKG
jgi:hypothetical protein